MGKLAGPEFGKSPQTGDPSLLVKALYKAAFGRLADPEGLAKRIQQLQSGVSLQALAEELTASAEFQARHGLSQKVDTAYIEALYRDGLGRQPDPEGLAHWLEADKKGATRAQVLAAFAGSNEAAARALVPLLEIPSELRRELREWQLAGKKARFWWRDDDAVSDTPELRRLLALAKEVRTVVGLAVIPEEADAALAKLVRIAPCCVWQHWSRHNWQFEEGDQEYSQEEFGEGRDLEPMMADAHNGQLALDRVFGETGWQRVFVPPFDAPLSVPFKLLLPSLGYWGLSAGLPLTPPVETVTEVNAEIDIMNWPGRNVLGLDLIAKVLIEQLELRRQGQISADLPIGLLTHHLTLDEGGWRLVTELFRFLKSHGAAELLPADLLFEQPHANPLGPPQTNLEGRQIMEGEQATVVITSCGRQDLLEITLDSFLQYNTFPIKEFIIVEDGDGAKNWPLKEKYRQYPFRWLATGRRVGQVAAIDTAYQAVRTELIFHCEDDWEFFASGFIEKSFAILARNASILLVFIRGLHDTNNHPILGYTLKAEGIPYRLLRHHYDAGELGIWHGFSWNPGLRRRLDYRLLGSFGTLDPEGTREAWKVEREASAFYQQRGFFAAIVADNCGSGYVRHIGGGRRVPVDHLANRSVTSRGTGSSEEGAHSKNHREPAAVARNRYARLLMARLAAQPRFGSVARMCAIKRDPGIDELLEWQIWTNQVTTDDQLRIEEQLDKLVKASSSILHIGAGNSQFGRRFAPHVARVLGTTLHDEERIFAEGLGIESYVVMTVNKFSEDMDRIDGKFDFIVDNNPSTFACCLFHFSRMMISYTELLKKDGGLLLTAQPGLSWVVTGNNPNWSLQWDDWVRLGKVLRMPVRRITEFVYSMECLPESGTASL